MASSTFCLVAQLGDKELSSAPLEITQDEINIRLEPQTFYVQNVFYPVISNPVQYSPQRASTSPNPYAASIVTSTPGTAPVFKVPVINIRPTSVTTPKTNATYARTVSAEGVTFHQELPPMPPPLMSAPSLPNFPVLQQASFVPEEETPSLPHDCSYEPAEKLKNGKPARFTTEQRDYLEKRFAENRFSKGADLDRMAHHLGVKPRRVKVWFQNKRQVLKSKNVNACE